MSSLMTYLATVQFGTLIFNDSYKDDQASKDYISGKLSIYFLISNLSVVLPAIGLGLLLDRVKVWKMVFMFHLLFFASILLFIFYAPNEENIYSSTVH